MERKADSLNSQTSRLTETATRRYSLTTIPDTMPPPATALQVPLTQATALPPGAAYTATAPERGAPSVSLTYDRTDSTLTIRARASPALTTTVEEESSTLARETAEISESLKTAETTETAGITETSAEVRDSKSRSGPLIGAVVALSAVLAFTIWRQTRNG